MGRNANHLGYSLLPKKGGGFFLDDPGERLLEADKLTWNCGRDDEDPFGHDRQWRHEVFRKYPDEIAVDLARQYLSDYEQGGRHGAAYELWRCDRELFDFPISQYLDDDGIRGLAESVAQRCRYVTSGMPETLAAQTVALVAREHGVALPITETTAGMVARLKCPIWWRRQLRKMHGRATETVAIRLNRVNRWREPYVSDRAVRSHRQQLARARDMLQGMEVVNELEEKFTLQELVERSVSNPRNRRAELMVRIAGLEQAARQRGHAGLFFHLTCPSRMHRAYFDSGRRNRRYDRTTPREAQRYLCKQWEKARAKLFRKGIRPYGFRVVEPHHDGTPHWHLLLFVPREHQEQLCQILKHYALQADGDEQGADERRLTVMPIDWELGTAAGYIAKYISKNIDGHGIDVDQYGHDAKKVAERIVTWASLWGIRQFQQIGGPPVTVWRELRRLCPEDVIGHLQGAVAAADEADWARFTELMGGPDAPRKKHPIKLHKAWNDALGRYGEPIGERIYGVECDSVITVTRVHTWKTRPASGPPNLHPVLEHGVGGRGNGSGGSPGPRVAAPGS